MKIAILTIFMAILAVNHVCALNILAIYPYSGKSHFTVFRIYLRELADRGHNVTVVSYFPEKDPPNNYHDINLDGGTRFEEEIPVMNKSYLTVLITVIILTMTGRENCEVLLANQNVQDLVNSKTKFDVVIVELFNSDCALGVAYKLGAPVVATTSHVLMPYHYKRFGIPDNPSYVSYEFLDGGTQPTLFQRVERVIFDFYIKLLYRFGVQWHNQNILAKYYDDIPPLEDLGREIRFLLLYHHFALTGSQILPANVIEVGGYHVSQGKPLTGGLKKFVEESEQGIIYINFGSMLKTSSLDPAKVKVILEAVKELPQRIIWKWEDKTLTFDQNKFYVDSWLPQVDILSHPKTLVFIGHAGLGGTTEAIHFGVPVIAMPVFGDQPANAAAIEESGIGVKLDWADLTKDSLLATLKRVIDPGFREQAAAVSRAWHDRPLSPLDTAVYWTEFAARHPALRVRTAAADTPFYQRVHLDVAAVFLGIILTILFVANLCLKRRKTAIVTTNKQAGRTKRD